MTAERILLLLTSANRLPSRHSLTGSIYTHIRWQLKTTTFLGMTSLFGEKCTSVMNIQYRSIREIEISVLPLVKSLNVQLCVSAVIGQSVLVTR